MSVACLSQITGGYNRTPVTKEVRQAAAFAVRKQQSRETQPLKLLAVSNARRQIVAGVNYALTLQVVRGRETRFAEVYVFESLQSTYKLRSWRWLEPLTPTKKG